MTGRRRLGEAILLVLPAVVGVAVMLWVTSDGLYASHDGLAYIGAARRLAAGLGFETPPGSPPIENFAPLFPLALAGIGKLGPDPLDVVRFLNPLLLGGTALLVSISVRRLTKSLPLGVLGGVLVAAGSDALTYYSSALSEPLFIFLASSAATALVGAVRRGGWWLVAASGFTAAAALTRYAGLALVAAGVVALVVLPRPRRWVEAGAFALGAAAPVALWLVASDGVGHRKAVWHWPDLEYLTNVRPLSVLLFGCALGVVVAGRRRLSLDAGIVLGLLAGAYLAVLFADRLLYDVTGRLDARFLLPLHVLAIAALLLYLPRSRAALSVLTAVAVVQLVAAGSWVQGARADDRGFVSGVWSEAPVFDEIGLTPPGQQIFTNAADVIAFHTGRVTRPIPEKRVFLTGKANGAYEAEVQRMRDDLSATGGVVVWFEPPARRVFLPTPEELGLRPLRRDAVSTTYWLSGR